VCFAYAYGIANGDSHANGNSDGNGNCDRNAEPDADMHAGSVAASGQYAY
jgi:hypothetical protein